MATSVSPESSDLVSHLAPCPVAVIGVLNRLINTLAHRTDMGCAVIAAPAVAAVYMSLLGLASRHGVLALFFFAAGCSRAVSACQALLGFDFR